MASTIGVGSAKVHTVEHLMSACAGLGLDNLYIDITASDAHPGWLACLCLLKAPCGVLQNAPKRFVRVKRPTRCARARVQLKRARLEPYHGFKLRFDIDFAHPAVDSTGQSVGSGI